jgi:hypothetical protein
VDGRHDRRDGRDPTGQLVLPFCHLVR